MKKTDEELREEALFNPMTYSLYSINKMLFLLHKMGVISDKQLIEMTISLLKSQEENKND